MGVGQLPLFKPESKGWKPVPVSKLPSWKNVKRLAIDCETHDPKLKELGSALVGRSGKILGVSFAFEGEQGYYLPIGHCEDNLDPEHVLSYLKDQAKDYKGDVVGANLQYDLGWLSRYDIEFPQVGFFRDVQIAEPLINELEFKYSLEAIGERYGIDSKDKGLLQEAAELYGNFDKKSKNRDPRKVMIDIPARFVGPYAIRDVESPLLIMREQEKIIDEQDLWTVFNLESKVLPILVKMRKRGVRIDEDQLDKVEKWALKEETEALKEVEQFTGRKIPVGCVWMAEKIKPVLESVGLKVGTTAKGKPNIDQHYLSSVGHPVTDNIGWARKVNKLRTTFVQSVRDHMVAGRIHCTFNQIARDDDESGKIGIKGPKYGRMSCEHPNIQQQPSRDEFAKMWRSIYVADEGGLWCSADYSQQEPRILSHYAVVSNCDGGAMIQQRYRENPSMKIYDLMAELTKLPHKAVKSVHLGLCYGMGGPKLARTLDLPTKRKFLEKYERWIEVAGDEAQEIIDKFNEEVPFVTELSERTKKRAMKKGFIKTILGRRCRFPKDAQGNYDWCFKALNRLIQGSAADHTKTAMVAVTEAGFNLQLQVHDELDLTVACKDDGLKVGRIMEDCLKFEIPIKAEVSIGKSWGEAE